MEITPETKTPAAQTLLDRYLTPIAVLVGACIIAFAISLGGENTGGQSNQPQSVMEAVIGITEDTEGIDFDRVEQLAEENRARYEAAIAADREEGAGFGINGTPSVVVAGELLSGLSPADYITQISALIDAQIAKGTVGTSVDMSALATDGVPFIGNPEATAVVALYYDYRCSFCHAFEAEVMPILVAQYVDTGKARVYFKDFQFLSQDSLETAVLGRAIWEAYPGSFYAWYEQVMTL